MRTFRYWVARCKDDSDAYSIIAETKKGCLKQLAEIGPEGFEPPVQASIDYKDIFDFFERVTGESGGRSCGIDWSADGSVARLLGQDHDMVKP